MIKKILLCGFMALFWIGSAEAVSLMQKMDVQIGIFDAATVSLSYQKQNQDFKIGAEVQTINFFDTLYPFIGKYESFGVVKANRVIPEIYKTSTLSRHHVRTKAIFYDNRGQAYQRISTKDDKVSERPIDNVPSTANAADLQSVFADLIEQFRTKTSCELVREVYDGKKHYKIIVKNDGAEKRTFAWRKKEETAHRCLVHIENLANNNDNILWEVSADKPIKLWIGRDERTKMPFVLQIVIDSTPLGMLQVTPTTLEIK